jgi:thioredoxin-like negative regulator of GroEL
LRRFAEARASVSQARALAPTSLFVAHRQVVVELAAGDLAAAQRVFSTLATEFPNDRMLAYIAMGYDLWWVPGERDQARLIELPASGYDDVPAALSTVRTQVHAARGERALAQAWADSAVRELRREMRTAPDDPQYRVILGLMLAYRGDSAAAIGAAQDGLARAQAAPSARMSDFVGYYHYLAARTALLAGDRARALGWLREVVVRRTMFSPGWIRADPAFAALKGDPAFERALAEAP